MVFKKKNTRSRTHETIKGTIFLCRVYDKIFFFKSERQGNWDGQLHIY